MKRNHIIEILLTIVSPILLLAGFEGTFDTFLVSFGYGSEYVVGMDNATLINPLPVYKPKNGKQTYYDNYTDSVVTNNTTDKLLRSFQDFFAAESNLKSHKSSYSANSSIAENALTNTWSQFGGLQSNAFQVKRAKRSNDEVESMCMKAFAFHMKSIGIYNPSANSTQGSSQDFVNTQLSGNNGYSKVPFNTNTSGDVVMLDPYIDPLAMSRIPIGSGEIVLIVLGLIYMIFKLFNKRMKSVR